MFFLSQLTLGFKDLQFLKISDEYSVHRVIYSLFKDYRSSDEKTASVGSGFLYAEQKRNTVGRQFLILSDRAPTNLTFKDGHIITKNVPDSFLTFPQYRFRVIVNPTVRDKFSGKLRPIIGKTNIAQWFSEKSLRSWGFSVVNLSVDSVEVSQFKGKNGRSLTIARAEISGCLVVTDFGRFSNSFRHGIGRAHAFGCGLLQLVPFQQ